MPRTVKAIIQYLLILSVTVFLIWVSLRVFRSSNANPLTYIWSTWDVADKKWLWIMAALLVVSFLIRAERWRMLLVSSGCQTGFLDSLLSLQVGYMINLAIPRGGEVSRCYNLFKLNGAPVDVAFGTVVAERTIDVVCLLGVVMIAFVTQTAKLMLFVDHLPIGESLAQRVELVVIIMLGLGILVAVGFFFLRRNPGMREKIKHAWQGFRKGLLSAFKVKRRLLFVFYSVIIWVIYFFMSYTILLAFPETDALGIDAVLVLYAVGSIAMALPLPGGTGSYHTLVPASLVLLYAIPNKDAVAFTFVFHGWQTFLMIVAGAISLLFTTLLVQRRARAKAETNS